MTNTSTEQATLVNEETWTCIVCTCIAHSATFRSSLSCSQDTMWGELEKFRVCFRLSFSLGQQINQLHWGQQYTIHSSNPVLRRLPPLRGFQPAAGAFFAKAKGQCEAAAKWKGQKMPTVKRRRRRSACERTWAQTKRLKALGWPLDFYISMIVPQWHKLDSTVYRLATWNSSKPCTQCTSFLIASPGQELVELWDNKCCNSDMKVGTIYTQRALQIHIICPSKTFGTLKLALLSWHCQLGSEAQQFACASVGEQ